MTAVWYLMRGTGAAALVLLSATVVLGVVNVRRLAPARVPRFVLDDVHRTLSLLVVALLAIHVTAAVVDQKAPIALVNALVPFSGGYRPLWLGLGGVALYLLAALIVTSLLRARLGLRTWRAIHWLAYACWPLALFHAIGIGTDVSAGWMLWVAIACAAAVLLAASSRLERPERVPAR